MRPTPHVSIERWAAPDLRDLNRRACFAKAAESCAHAAAAEEYRSHARNCREGLGPVKGAEEFDRLAAQSERLAAEALAEARRLKAAAQRLECP
jgi:hypothetical protein